MGVAVIMLTILIRILLLPMSLREEKSEKDRRQLAVDAALLEQRLSHDPIARAKEKKRLFRKNRSIIVGEFITLMIQIIIAVMLYRMFKTGLPGHDIELLYPFMPKVAMPFNLTFLGKIDLTEPHMLLNVLQSVLILLVETVSILTSPYPASRGEVVRMQLILPVLAFVIFMNFPAGKKLFVITTLIISFFLILYKFFRRKFRYYVELQQEKALAKAQGDQVLVETKE